MSRIQKFAAGAALGVTVFLAGPGLAAADSGGCYTGCQPPQVVASSVVPPTTGASPMEAGSSANPTASGSSSLPFTGADVIELTAIGVGAVVVGGVLARRRHTTS